MNLFCDDVEPVVTQMYLTAHRVYFSIFLIAASGHKSCVMKL